MNGAKPEAKPQKRAAFRVFAWLGLSAAVLIGVIVIAILLGAPNRSKRPRSAHDRQAAGEARVPGPTSAETPQSISVITNSCPCSDEARGTALRINSGIKQPVLKDRVELPWSSFKPGTKGSGGVIAEVVVTRSGDVCGVRFLKLPTFEPAWPEFEALAAQALCKWKYEPATIGGTPVTVFFTLTSFPRWVA